MLKKHVHSVSKSKVKPYWTTYFRLLTHFFHSNLSPNYIFLNSWISKFPGVRLTSLRTTFQNYVPHSVSFIKWNTFNGITSLSSTNVKVSAKGNLHKHDATQRPSKTELPLSDNRLLPHSTRTEWREHGRGRHVEPARARYDYSRSFMDEGAEHCRMKQMWFRFLTAFTPFTASNTPDTFNLFPKGWHEPDAPLHPSRTRIAGARKSPHLIQQKEIYTYILDFKLWPCCECRILSSGLFPGVWIVWHRGITQKKEYNIYVYTDQRNDKLRH